MKKLILSIAVLCLFAHSAIASSQCGNNNTNNYSSLHSTERLIANLDDEGQYTLWQEPEKSNLTYCIHTIHEKLRPILVEAMKLATEEWEAYANIDFTYKPEEDDNCDKNNSNVFFRVRIQNSKHIKYSAKAFFPDYPPEKRNVYFKKRLVERDFAYLTWIAKHELGHVLGFRHEHINPDNPNKCSENDKFDPITDYDVNSVMHYLVCGGKAVEGLSDKDKEGAGIAYPF